MPSDTPSVRKRHSMISGTAVVFRREIAAYFDSPIAYVYAAVFLALSCGVFMNDFFLLALVDMSAYFRLLPLVLVLFIPAVTMRSWAEEHARGTFELVSALPLRLSALVSGKFLAALSFFTIVLAGSVPLVIMLSWLGAPVIGVIASSYLGSVCLGAFFLAFGCFISGLTREQIVAYVLTTFGCALFVLTGHEAVVDVLDGLSVHLQIGTRLYETVSVMPHFESFCRGIIGLNDLLYFSVMTAFFLLMNDMTLRLSKY